MMFYDGSQLQYKKKNEMSTKTSYCFYVYGAAIGSARAAAPTTIGE